MRYHICLIPSEPVFGELDKIIVDLSQKYGGPLFHPHLTIHNPIEKPFEELKKAIAEAVQNIAPLQLSLGPVSFSTTYHQAVFVRVNSQADLMNLNLALKKSFGTENTVYMPHLSLLYGDHAMETREKVASEITLEHKAFTIDKIAIIPDDPDPINWVSEITIPFGKK